MCRILAELTTLDQHLRMLDSDPASYRPEHCLHCGHSGLWAHGVYCRAGDKTTGSTHRKTRIPIPRFFCPPCGRTCSRVPACLAPRRWYPWWVQAMVLQMLLLGFSQRSTAKESGLDRRTVGRWWGWLQAHYSRFSFHLRSHFADLGRHADVPAFWSACLSRPGLAGAMATLCRLQVCVP